MCIRDRHYTMYMFQMPLQVTSAAEHLVADKATCEASVAKHVRFQMFLMTVRRVALFAREPFYTCYLYILAWKKTNNVHVNTYVRINITKPSEVVQSQKSNKFFHTCCITGNELNKSFGMKLPYTELEYRILLWCIITYSWNTGKYLL